MYRTFTINAAYGLGPFLGLRAGAYVDRGPVIWTVVCIVVQKNVGGGASGAATTIAQHDYSSTKLSLGQLIVTKPTWDFMFQ